MRKCNTCKNKYPKEKVSPSLYGWMCDSCYKETTKRHEEEMANIQAFIDRQRCEMRGDERPS